MIKKRYYALSKDDKIKIKEEYYNTEIGRNMKRRLNRLLILGTILVLISIYLFIDAKNIWNYIYAGMIALAGLIFIIGNYFIRIKKINTYLINKKKK